MGNAKSRTLRSVKASKEIHQRNPISISPEVLADVLAFQSRKNLLQQLCHVNYLFFQVANRLPSVHIVRFICFASPPVIQLVHPCSHIVSEFPLKTLPIHVPFFRFREVEITKLLQTASLYFLLCSKKSFKSSRLYITIERNEPNPGISPENLEPNPGTHLKIQDQINTLLEEIFVECSQIRIRSRFMEPQKVAITKGVLASDRLELQFYEEQICDSGTSKVLIAWLSHKEGQPGARRHLVLKNYPMAGNVEIIEALKKDQINTLLEEIFVEGSQIRINSRFLEPQKVAKTKGVLASDRLELQFFRGANMRFGHFKVSTTVSPANGSHYLTTLQEFGNQEIAAVFACGGELLPIKTTQFPQCWQESEIVMFLEDSTMISMM
ncbi:hypothetical protein DdX_17419 [Ditylenchus destructor]|uniref:Uncharacterized protein n=1 Tax=Ditylenchus destructor TaxID=166010 RepID=A0AAD4QZ12_9BILA|nr:hypothetical protein DdX_17419 [Ditylenchus destructor]